MRSYRSKLSTMAYTWTGENRDLWELPNGSPLGFLSGTVFILELDKYDSRWGKLLAVL